MLVHELVEAMAKANPHAIALQDKQKQVTYGELLRRADLLADRLQRSYFQSDPPIALFLHRSCDLAIGALGILKAGAAYLPLDPADPANRVSMALEDSDCKLVVTQKCLTDRLPAGDWQTIILDEDDARIAARSEIRAPDQANGLAYVIFTSGSTGRPKGVQITHANLLNLIEWHLRAFEVTPSDQTTMQASPGFDAAVWELWPSLVAGATVHVVGDSLRADPKSLRDWMVATGITISFLPTATAESMIALEWPAETKLRYLLTGADVLRRAPSPGLPFTLVNNYGPTECTVVATSGSVPHDPATTGLPAIGRPIENVQAYVVNDRLQPVPAGVVGELLIGGVGVGRGYMNLPELTEQKFLPDRFGGVDGARLYRTGDLVRMETDGQIHFLGRVDQQLKIRGFRIEPGEIEAVMQQHPAVHSSIAAARSLDSGEANLIAYVVLKPNVSGTAGDLRSFLAEYLPDHMVPSMFVKIAELPITNNGKIDRSSLPAPTAENILSEGQFESPQAGIESRLASFLVRMLGVSQIGRNDNFFRLGGHSLLGAQLIAKIQQTFDVELSLRSLFDNPTVAGLASEVTKAIYAKLDAMSEDDARTTLASLSGEITI
jgi:amino acid adenylation domain-containing protein